jgi:hypothetical protein
MNFQAEAITRWQFKCMDEQGLNDGQSVRGNEKLISHQSSGDVHD